ncbi:MAG: tail fiber protein [Oscillatoriophycideae cyanobacterium NC_groundwater_1537_Pr4_S-0.65um_50_18]|nr:tail fiber protein [Oscillatoriophycideae cyanobacterium NC_groundwater_1537_Pr4_S-0.65um_50_18]
MPQHDFFLANQSMAPFRQDLNNALLAIQTLSAGAIEPNPTQPFMFWVNSSTNILYQRSSDNLSWMPRGPVDLPYFGLVPTGEVKMFAGPTAPPGFLVCDGTPISRTTYSTLFSVIGTTYGVGNGGTTFNLPDMRGRVPVGVGQASSGGSTNRLLGAQGGADTVSLDASTLPTHSHTATSDGQGTHGHAGSYTSSVGDHIHAISTPIAIPSTGPGSQQIAATNNPNAGAIANSTGGAGSHNHTVVIPADGYHAHNIAVGNAGSGAAHNNLQPYLSLNFIIKT